jgi:hypothetical protein
VDVGVFKIQGNLGSFVDGSGRFSRFRGFGLCRRGFLFLHRRFRGFFRCRGGGFFFFGLDLCFGLNSLGDPRRFGGFRDRRFFLLWRLRLGLSKNQFDFGSFPGQLMGRQLASGK